MARVTRLVGIGADVVWRLARKATSRTSDGAQAAESPRYCYAVWLRHLALAGVVPRDVLELGPGASVGVGYAALLSGAETYVGLDSVARAGRTADPDLLDSIAGLLASRAPIPGPIEFPEVLPTLADYSFPDRVLSNELLTRSLTPERVAGLAGAITYRAPWTATAIAPASVDLIVSQAVMEHVDDPDAAYAAMARWLRPGGLASHQIDFRSHGVSRTWNGQWRYPPRLWPRVRGTADPINRWPLSAHLAAIEREGLSVRTVQSVVDHGGLRRGDLDPAFRWLTDEDFITAGAFIQFVR
jgi:SAM-dependent methyltransferase